MAKTPKTESKSGGIKQIALIVEAGGDLYQDVGKGEFHFVSSLCSGLFSHSVMSQE